MWVVVGLVVVGVVVVVVRVSGRSSVGRRRRAVVGRRLCFILKAKVAAGGLWMMELLRCGLGGASRVKG